MPKAGFLLLMFVLVFTQQVSASEQTVELRGLLGNNHAATETSTKYLKYIAAFQGKCTKAIFLGKNYIDKCQGNVVNVLRKDGYSEFIFIPRDRVVLAFAGKKEELANPMRYVLNISLLRLVSNGQSQGGMLAKGRCTVNGDISKSVTISCIATSIGGNEGEFRYEFVSTRPVELKKLGTLIGQSFGPAELMAE